MSPNIDMAKLTRLRMDLTEALAARQGFGVRYRDLSDYIRQHGEAATDADREQLRALQSRMDVINAKLAPLASLVSRLNAYVEGATQ